MENLYGQLEIGGMSDEERAQIADLNTKVGNLDEEVFGFPTNGLKSWLDASDMASLEDRNYWINRADLTNPLDLKNVSMTNYSLKTEDGTLFHTVPRIPEIKGLQACCVTSDDTYIPTVEHPSDTAELNVSTSLKQGGITIDSFAVGDMTFFYVPVSGRNAKIDATFELINCTSGYADIKNLDIFVGFSTDIKSTNPKLLGVGLDIGEALTNQKWNVRRCFSKEDGTVSASTIGNTNMFIPPTHTPEPLHAVVYTKSNGDSPILKTAINDVSRSTTCSGVFQQFVNMGVMRTYAVIGVASSNIKITDLTITTGEDVKDTATTPITELFNLSTTQYWGISQDTATSITKSGIFVTQYIPARDGDTSKDIIEIKTGVSDGDYTILLDLNAMPYKYSLTTNDDLLSIFRMNPVEYRIEVAGESAVTVRTGTSMIQVKPTRLVLKYTFDAVNNSPSFTVWFDDTYGKTYAKEMPISSIFIGSDRYTKTNVCQFNLASVYIYDRYLDGVEVTQLNEYQANRDSNIAEQKASIISKMLNCTDVYNKLYTDLGKLSSNAILNSNRLLSTEIAQNNFSYALTDTVDVDTELVTITGYTAEATAQINKITGYDLVVPCLTSNGDTVGAVAVGLGNSKINSLDLLGTCITELPDSFVANSTALEAVKLPASITTVGNNAFSGCTALTDVYYEGTVEQRVEIVCGTGNDKFTGAVWHYSV